MYSQSHVEGARTWFPCFEAERSSFSMEFTVKPDFVGTHSRLALGLQTDCVVLTAWVTRYTRMCSRGIGPARKADPRGGHTTTDLLLQVSPRAHALGR
jgi:hypothetical protein